MRRKIEIEGYVYEFCYDDKLCHTFISPKRLTPKRIKELIGTTDEEDEENIRKFMKTNRIPWYMYYIELHKIGEVPCIILEKFLGKKVRITIEVVGGG